MCERVNNDLPWSNTLKQNSNLVVTWAALHPLNNCETSRKFLEGETKGKGGNRKKQVEEEVEHVGECFSEATWYSTPKSHTNRTQDLQTEGGVLKVYSEDASVKSRQCFLKKD